MSEILFHYKRPDPTTWVYLSSFLTIGLFFVFHRFWSMRNLDLVLLILLAPGLLIVHEGRRARMLEDFEARSAEARAAEQADSKAIPADVGGPDAPDGLSSGDGAAVPPASQAAVASVPAGAEEDADAAMDANAESVAVGSSPEAPTFAARDIERYGFVWLLVVQVLILVRLLLDPLMVRRPLLDPNLTAGGLMFIGIWLFIFMMANVITSTPRMQDEQGPRLGPGYSLMNMLPAIITRPPIGTGDDPARFRSEPTAPPAAQVPPTPYVALARVLAIASHLAIVLGIVAIGHRHFGNSRGGIGCATLYLLLPYTAQMTGRVDHALPAAFLIWAVFSYRRPFFAGFFLGGAAGLVYYPLFLLPLWIAFYRQRGVSRFMAGVGLALVIMMALLEIDGSLPLKDHLQRMFGLMMPLMNGLQGVWGLGWEPIYRLPLMVGFLILSGFFALWPAQKNLGTLIAYSSALMVAAQFWHAYGGGLYMAWFLPLLLLTIFRPNLEDRIAAKVIDAGPQLRVKRPRIADVA